ncbi:MAG: hypothetical protein V4475_01765 [Pseudomonadota bacterium]
MSAARTGGDRPGFFHAYGPEVRLGSVQRGRLESCLNRPARCGPRNPSFVRLLEEGFVTSEQHVSARTGRPTTDRLYTITEEGRRYLRVGCDR